VRDQREYVTTVLKVLDDRHCKSIFAPEAITESPISGNLVEDGQTYKVSGRIDRLLINDHEIKIIDFKTNKIIPSSHSEVPDSYKKQLAIYYRLVRQIYPAHQISCIILWVEKPMIMELVSNDMESMQIF